MSDSIKSGGERLNKTRRGGFSSGFLFFAGILLPAITFVIELTTRWCATSLFDPMPTWWHALLIFFVPVTNLQTWLAIRRGSAERLGWLSFSNAAAIFISLFYTLIFAPVTPIAVLAIIYFFVGLLPLAPLFSLIAAVLMRRELKKIAPDRKPWLLGWKGLAAGSVLVFSLIALSEIPFTLTKIGVRKASSADPKEQNEGLSYLRRYGDRDYLLRLCYSNSGFVTTDWVLNFFDAGKTAQNQSSDEPLMRQAQKAFYRLTGKNYRQVPTPRGIRNWDFEDGREFVDENASMRLNQGLSLRGSQIDGSVDADAALGYLEWTLVFRNEQTLQQEALAQIQLPPNAVVSRLTLWINGEEREAAFAKSAKVVEAYNAVTRTRRDPALLTVTGKDRVQLKCFPVPAGGEMKVRIGITTPLVLENENKSLLPMPYFQDRNFSVATPHAVWIESKKELEIANQEFVRDKRENLFAVRGAVKDEDLIKIGSPVRISKTENIKISWAKDTNNPQQIVKQEIRETEIKRPERLIFVVDVSEQMKPFQTEIADALKNLTNEIETVLILTGGNGLNAEQSAPNYTSGRPEQSSELVKKAVFGGGTDAVPAIRKAWDLAQEKPNGSTIVWIHAPQPVDMESPLNLTQLWARRPDSAPIYSFQTRNGADVVERVLNESNALETVPRFASLGDDLKRFLSRFNEPKKIFEAVRTVEKVSAISTNDAKETSQHLVRLWASDEVKRLLRNREDEKAIELAVKNQLVTQISGAVVLETQQQYDQFGLKPVDAGTVPTIPEPEEYLLFGIVLIFLVWFFRRFRRQGFQSA